MRRLLKAITVDSPKARLWVSFSSAALLALAFFTHRSVAAVAETEALAVPTGFPQPEIPHDNPFSSTKALLGRYLFYDKRLSVNSTRSCADCHHQELAFTDGHAVPAGATGEKHSRSAMSLVNVAYQASLTWNNPNLHSLEEQVFIPLFGEHPVELGMKGKDSQIAELLRADPVYAPLFPKSFPHEADPFTIVDLAKAIATFERTILSARSPYDRFRHGDRQAISEAAQRGEFQFFLEPIGCFRCHNGLSLSDSMGGSAKFHNTGLYNVPGRYSYPAPNLGIFEYTHQPQDVGRFRTPSLRNVAVTAPYMHDGSIPTLEAVVDHYAAGGRTIEGGPLAGNGSHNPNRDPALRGFAVSEQIRNDLVAFLRSLTDEELLHDRRFSNPWGQKP